MVQNYEKLQGFQKSKHYSNSIQFPGPVLYISGSNSIIRAILYSFFKLFVDDDDIDSSCYISDLDVTIYNINRDLENILRWTEKIGISINSSKTKALIFGSKYNLNRLQYMNIPSIILNNKVIPFCNVAKNLGVILSTDLTWNEHVSSIIAKVNKSLGPLYRNAISFPISVKKTLLLHLVVPHIDYCCVVYHSFSDYLDSKIQKLQNRCIRFIYGLRQFEHITPYRRKLEWLTPKARRIFFMAIQTFKIIMSKKPEYLYSDIVLYKAVAVRNLRPTTVKPFDIPMIKSETYSKSYAMQAMVLWNMLPSSIINSPTLPIFKKKLFVHLIITDKN